MRMRARSAVGLVWWSGETMGIALEIPPLLDVILTLSAMLGLFTYVYWLAGKEDREMHRVDEIKRVNSDATATPHESNPSMKGVPTSSHGDQWVVWISRKITLYQAAKRKQ